MEPHPIPQNVTSFEFRLVGDMTLKQFLYLGAGLGTAYLLYATLYFSYPIVALPLIIFSILFGVSFAFLPILDMPLDHWVKAFFNAVYSPTKGTWQTKPTSKQKITPDDPFFKNRLQTYLSSKGMNLNAWDNQTPLQTNVLSGEPVANTQQIQQTVNIAPELPTNKELSELVEMGKQAQILQTKITDTEKLIKQMTAEGRPSSAPQVSTNLQHLVAQTEELYKKTSEMNRATTPAVSQPQPPPQAIPQPIVMPKPVIVPKIEVIKEVFHQQASVVLTSTPNVINGIVSDPMGNYLENVIIIIHNKEGIPVRALKTNKLGQFVGSTPLTPGVYTVTLEKEGYSFQTLQITLENTALTPIKITAGKGGS